MVKIRPTKPIRKPAPRKPPAVVARERFIAKGPIRSPATKEDRLVQSPVFLLSSVRSGSTLLRMILDSHSMIHAPHETHFRRLLVSASTPPTKKAMAQFDLTEHDIEHLLWDRFLHRELALSGKSVIVEKTPSNVFAAGRLRKAWPESKFIFLLRHPVSIAQSWHEADPVKRPMDLSISHTLKFMNRVEAMRRRHDGPVLRYEELTADPEAAAQSLCAFLDVPYEPSMLEYGRHDHGEISKGIGDWRDKIRTGTIQPGRALPQSEDEIPEELREMCRLWGYLPAASVPEETTPVVTG